MNVRPVTHVLFDMDGLILDTENVYNVGFQKMASRYGKDFTYKLQCKVMGKQSREIAQTIIDELELPLTVDEFITESRIILNELYADCKVMPGIQKLLEHLSKNDVPVGLATSSSKESYEMKTANHQEVFDLFPYKTWGSSEPNVKRGKPFPDVFLAAAAKFPDKPSPNKCLVFEDSINGIRGARAAGMQVVMVPDPQLDRSLILDATLVLNSIEEFQPEMFGLPPYKD